MVMNMVGMTGKRKAKILSVFLLPNLLGTIIFLLIPIFSSFILSFTNWDLLSSIEFIGLENYIDILKDDVFYESLRHTLTFIVGYIPSVMIIALGLALILNKKLKGIVVFRALHFLPVITSWVAVSLIWMWLFNPEYGLINYGLSIIGITGPAWLQDQNWAMIAVIITSVWKDIGFVMVIYLAGLQEIPKHYYEAAGIDGANKFQQFINITVPLLSPTTFFVLVISLINSFQVFDQVWIMTGGGPVGATSVLVEQIYKNAFRYYKMGYASAYSMILFAIIFTITYLQNRIEKKVNSYES